MLQLRIRTPIACVCFTVLGCSSSSPGGDVNGSAGAAQAVIGPIPVGANVEKTVCVTKDLGNADDLVISGYSATLDPGSHHLIVYASTDTQESLTPTPCMPFVGLAEGNVVPLVLVNKLNLSWSFPSGVAVEVPAHQMVRIEAHYINASAKDIMGVGTVTFQGTPKASAPPFTPASFFFWGTEKIDIPAGARSTVGPNFQAGTPGTHLISIFTHQHELGTGVQVWESARQGDTASRIVNDTDWTNPSWNLLTPQFDMTGTNGLTYQCDWYNTTQSAVTFGESALDEMCFIGGYYYPGKGFDLRIDGTGPQTVVSSGFSDGGSD
jgi:Copper type II ascorbate-dependent monooxygenase, C-terminal domain